MICDKCWAEVHCNHEENEECSCFCENQKMLKEIAEWTADQLWKEGFLNWEYK